MPDQNNQQPAHAVMLIALGDDHYAAVLLDDDGEVLDAAAGTADDCAAFCGSQAYFEPVLVDKRGGCVLTTPRERRA